MNHPEKCKHSKTLCDIYICTLELLPCARVNPCALVREKIREERLKALLKSQEDNE